MSAIRFLKIALSPATAALLAASLVASCEPTSDVAPVSARSPATAADVGVERVVLQAYRAIGDRHLNEPDFRKIVIELQFRGPGKLWVAKRVTPTGPGRGHPDARMCIMSPSCTMYVLPSSR